MPIKTKEGLGDLWEVRSDLSESYLPDELVEAQIMRAFGREDLAEAILTKWSSEYDGGWDPEYLNFDVSYKRSPSRGENDDDQFAGRPSGSDNEWYGSYGPKRENNDRQRYDVLRSRARRARRSELFLLNRIWVNGIRLGEPDLTQARDFWPSSDELEEGFTMGEIEEIAAAAEAESGALEDALREAVERDAEERYEREQAREERESDLHYELCEIVRAKAMLAYERYQEFFCRMSISGDGASQERDRLLNENLVLGNLARIAHKLRFEELVEHLVLARDLKVETKFPQALVWIRDLPENPEDALY
ncbi:MAG: hypothetical protein V1716_05160 [Candidatus Uhrbacteria bacterium]